MYNAHLLIAFNRLWAVLHPLSYRSMHSAQMATFLCILMWAYVHAVVAPGWLWDLLHNHRQPGRCRWIPPQWPGWSEAVQFVIFGLPQIVMTLVFPLFLWAQLGRRGQVRPLGRRILSGTAPRRSCITGRVAHLVAGNSK